MNERNKAVQCAQVLNKMHRARERARLTTQEMLDNFNILGSEEMFDYLALIEKHRHDWQVWSRVYIALNPQMVPHSHL